MSSHYPVKCDRRDYVFIMFCLFVNFAFCIVRGSTNCVSSLRPYLFAFSFAPRARAHRTAATRDSPTASTSSTCASNRARIWRSRCFDRPSAQLPRHRPTCRGLSYCLRFWWSVRSRSARPFSSQRKSIAKYSQTAAAPLRRRRVKFSLGGRCRPFTLAWRRSRPTFIRLTLTSPHHWSRCLIVTLPRAPALVRARSSLARRRRRIAVRRPSLTRTLRSIGGACGG